MNDQYPDLTRPHVSQHAPVRHTAEAYESVSTAGLISFEIAFFLVVGFLAYTLTADRSDAVASLRSSSALVGQSIAPPSGSGATR